MLEQHATVARALNNFSQDSLLLSFCLPPKFKFQIRRFRTYPALSLSPEPTPPLSSSFLALYGCVLALNPLISLKSSRDRDSGVLNRAEESSQNLHSRNTNFVFQGSFRQTTGRLVNRLVQTMAKESVNNYEEARKQRVEANKKQFEDLGILKISKSLSDLKSSGKKPVQRLAKPKSENAYVIEPRRSSRARNPVSTYQEEVDFRRSPSRKRSKFSSSWASYLARPIDEVRTASYKERAHAFKCAEKLESNLTSGNPSFVKSMVRSHVYSCFWLGLPSKFCDDHLPKSTVDIVLENENGAEYASVFIGKRAGVSGGWRAFALDHKLDDGDALVFELVEPTRFKVYIVRASNRSSEVEEEEDTAGGDEVDSDAKNTSDGAKEHDQNRKAEAKRVTRSKTSGRKRKK